MRALIAVTVAAGLVFSTSAFAAGGEELAKAKNCMTCHKTDAKLIGPSYKDVAAKYAKQKDAVATLSDKVIKGGVGVWGQVPMTPNPQITPDEAKTMVTWIMTLK
jgi:cytochrome c